MMAGHLFVFLGRFGTELRRNSHLQMFAVYLRMSQERYSERIPTSPYDTSSDSFLPMPTALHITQDIIAGLHTRGIYPKINYIARRPSPALRNMSSTSSEIVKPGAMTEIKLTPRESQLRGLLLMWLVLSKSRKRSKSAWSYDLQEAGSEISYSAFQVMTLIPLSMP